MPWVLRTVEEWHLQILSLGLSETQMVFLFDLLKIFLKAATRDIPVFEVRGSTHANFEKTSMQVSRYFIL